MWIFIKTFCIILFLKSFLCCDCNKKNIVGGDKKHGIDPLVSDNSGAKDTSLDKRQLDFEEDLSIDLAMGISTVGPENTTNDTTTHPTSVTTPKPTNETSTDTQTTVIDNNVDDDKLKKCSHYKKGAEFDMNLMADVWENTYYQMKQNLTCFRIHLKTVTIEEQKYYEKIYGNFNNVVNWDKCTLQVKAGPKTSAETKKHFLQTTASDKGVMDNIIIVEDYDDKTTTITLRKENPDQWLLVNDLLLMRDCDDGDVVVFSRVPFQPRRNAIKDALATFGENKPNGKFGCSGDDIRASTLTSDGDELFE